MCGRAVFLYTGVLLKPLFDCDSRHTNIKGIGRLTGPFVALIFIDNIKVFVGFIWVVFND